MAKRKNEAAQQQYRVRLRLIDLASSIGNNLLKWGSLVLIAYFCARAIESLAGKVTFADVALKIIADMHFGHKISYIIGLGGIGYGLLERGLRRRNIRRLESRPRELEKMINPQRTSSRITPSGTTRPEDRT